MDAEEVLLRACWRYLIVCFPKYILVCFIPAADLVTVVLQHHAATKGMAPGLFKAKPIRTGV